MVACMYRAKQPVQRDPTAPHSSQTDLKTNANVDATSKARAD